ncbi:hypothetical protein BC835DRAFT_789630 [Cytidiella melzeri]|nr:hypothetical protein BC835DRAFT_789630 [Cytidiella melzeri]
MSWSTTTMTTSSASFKTSGTSFNQTLVPSSTPSPSPSPVIVATTISTLTYVSSGEAAANSPSGGTQSPVKNSSSSNSPTSLIVGAVAAGLVGLMLLVVATTLLLRIVRRKALSHPPRLDLDNMSESAEGRETLMRSTLLHSQPSSSSHASLLASSFYSSEEDARSVFRPISGSVQSSSERRALVRSSHTTEASQLESHDDTSGHTRVLLDRIQALEQSLSQLTEREEWPPAYSAA